MGIRGIKWGCTCPGESELTSTRPAQAWHRGVKCTRRPQLRKSRADENRAVSIGKRNTKRRQVSKNCKLRFVTLTVPTLSLVDSILIESQKWDSKTLINRQILMDEEPCRRTDMATAWEQLVELYFQAQGLSPRAQCGQWGCPPKQPHVILAKADGAAKQQPPLRKLIARAAATTVGSTRPFATVETKQG
jgi:hypothetical protein